MIEPQRILVIETLYLGDLIHALPLIQALRLRYPAAQLDVLVRSAHVSLMQCVQGIDKVIAYEPKKHRGLGGMWSLCRQLRVNAYDLVLNPGASDRAAIFTALSGGKERIGRLNRNRSRWIWPLLHDEVLDRPWGADPMYWQKLTAFSQRLDLDTQVRFGLNTSGTALEHLALPSGYVHISPFASEAIRCIPPATLVELITLLRARFPALPVVVSCGPSATEVTRLNLLQPHLLPLGVFCLPGILDLPSLAALIQRASAHVGPDSGPLHLAVALQTPSVGCFLFKDHSAEWLPLGALHRSFGVASRLEGGIYGLPLDLIVEHLGVSVRPLG